MRVGISSRALAERERFFQPRRWLSAVVATGPLPCAEYIPQNMAAGSPDFPGPSSLSRRGASLLRLFQGCLHVRLKLRPHWLAFVLQGFYLLERSLQFINRVTGPVAR